MLRSYSVNVTASHLCMLFAAQLDPASQIVICFLFAQLLVCKLLSVNQATNYTAAAANWNHFYLGTCSELKRVTCIACFNKKKLIYFLKENVSDVKGNMCWLVLPLAFPLKAGSYRTINEILLMAAEAYKVMTEVKITEYHLALSADLH